MVVQAVGIKETLEVLEAARLLVVDLRKILADGKISTGDVGVIFDLLRQLPALNAGLQGVDLVPVEVKDIDAQEAEKLIAKALEIGAALKA